MDWTAIAIFAITYALISARRLQWLGFDRPAAVLLGAVACVASGSLSPEEAIAAVDGATLLLLLGVMGMGAFLAVDGFFDHVERHLVALAGTPTRLIGCVVWGAGALAALLTNDAVCLLGAPLLVRLIHRQRLPALPFLLALATGANTGSVATLVGNPQNMLCGLLGGLSYLDHLALVGPIAVACLALNHALIALLFRGPLATASLRAEPSGEPLPNGAKLTLGVIAGTAVAFALGGHLAWTATGGFVALMLLRREDTRRLWAHVDFSLLLFFAGLFVVVEALHASGAPQAAFDAWPLRPGTTGPAEALALAGVFLVGSNIVSNVPFILVIAPEMEALGEPRWHWELLAVASTFAGNLTLLGSVANVIVAEAGRDVGGMGFFAYLRVGLPLALGSTAIAALWLWAVAA